jgi:type IV pilus biogenesis protein CpaD/CtpE
VHAPRPRGRLVAVLAALTAALVACSAEPVASPTLPSPNETLPPIELDGDWTWTKQETALELGVTHTQKSLDDTEPAEARQRGIDILSADSAIWQNHHLMGFGTDNPEPEPGAYDWSTSTGA